MLKAIKIFIVFILILDTGRVYAQNNYGFENGLSGWKTVGAGNISIDKSNFHSGSNCVKIGNNYGAVMQHIDAIPLSIVSFNMFVKSSDTTVKGYSFIRFYNSEHKKILEYKSKPVTSVTYKETGNYTETPVGTSYMKIGIERDSTAKGFIYADDFTIETNVGTPKVKHQPACNLDQYMRPFWKSDTVYNETVLLYSVAGGTANGKLLYTPSKILSVKKFDLGTIYKPGVDYKLTGNVIERVNGSNIPFRADTSFDTKKDLAWFNTESQWVVVTYIHHDKWSGVVPTYKGTMVPHTIAKLKAKKSLKIVAYGMSITRGLDVSSYDNVPPYMPTYVDLFTNQLKKAYRYNDIKLYNAGLPGAVVDWGAKYADEYVSVIKPDLVIIDFGMNDFWRMTPEQFKGYIQTIINKVKKVNPQVEFLLLSNMKFDPDYVLDSDKTKSWYQANMEGYSKVLQQMEAKGVINLDMTAISDILYHKKKAKDCIANPLHPNDYLARWYAQGMAQLLINK